TALPIRRSVSVRVPSVDLVQVTSFVFLSFFFSSRRRHTRFSRDWSSDVCSSDLDRNSFACLDFPQVHEVLARTGAQTRRAGPDRSEERRVGKECRARWSRDREKTEERLKKRQEERGERS